jgi:nicotinate-nucleotide pyrophosphorylase (carboxylating)
MKLADDEIERFIDMALAEDVGRGDITTAAVVPEPARLAADMHCRQDIVVAGIDIALGVFRRLAVECQTQVFTPDGARAAAGTTLAHIEGPARALLSAERTALNIVQNLSGIATLTHAFVDRIAGTGATLLDTRKTVPGMRLLAKYATSVGGARNHRMRLDDGVIIKDNHIAVCGGVGPAVAAAKAAGLRAIEVECDSLEQVRDALEAGADRLMLDNMDLETLRGAVAMARGRVPTEASGGVTLETVRRIAETGVDFISVGRITHSAPAVDIGLDFSDPGGGAD